MTNWFTRAKRALLNRSGFIAANNFADRSHSYRRKIAFEILEPRLTLHGDEVLNGAVPLNADFDNSGMVDAADYLIWRANEGITNATARSQGDADRDGAVDLEDYEILALAIRRAGDRLFPND